METCILVITFLDLKAGCGTRLLTAARRVLLNYDLLLSASLGRSCSSRIEEWVAK